MPQELNTKMMEPLKNKDEVRPFDTVKVYATGKAGKSGKAHVNAGDELEVHPLLADKLIASGKATKEAPKKDAKK